MEELRVTGQRLRAFRIGAGLSAEDLADKLRVSRATIYRLESAGVARLDMVRRIADLLNVSIAALLGAEVEYIKTALVYFERLRQIEAQVDWSFVAFGPVSYLLTSDEYDIMLRQSLLDRIPASEPDPAGARTAIRKLMRILASRKHDFSQRRPRISNLLSISDLREFARWGLSGPDDYRPGHTAFADAARRELELIIRLIEHPPLGIQIGVSREYLPTTSFNILRGPAETTVTVSPFRLGPRPNVRQGVATISAARDAVRLYSELSDDLWSTAAMGREAADLLRKEVLAASG